MRDLLTKGREIATTIETDAAGIAVWFVGLASTLLVAAVANNITARRVLGTNHFWVMLLLWLTIFSGSAYKVVGLWLRVKLFGHLFKLEGALVGLVAANDNHMPPLCSPGWDEAEIVQKIKDEFGTDYRFLLEYKVPVERCRTIYEGLRERWEENDRRGMEGVRALVDAYFDNPEDQPMPALVDVRKHVRFLKRIGRLNGWILLTCAGSFSVAMFLVARGLWLS